MIKDENGDLDKKIWVYIKERVKAEQKKNGHRCRFDVIDSSDIKTIAHAIESARQLGDGSLSKALAIGLENHKWIASQRHKFDCFYKIFIRALIISLATSVLTALWVGFKQLAGN